MDTKKIIETVNTTLTEVTEVAVAIHDALNTSTEAVTELLDCATNVPSSLRIWDMSEFSELPIMLKEHGFSDEATVKLVEIYYANQQGKQNAVVAAVSDGLQGAITALQGAQGFDLAGLLGLVPAFVPKASAAAPGPVEVDEDHPLATAFGPALQDYLNELKARAAEGDEIAAELLSRYAASLDTGGSGNTDKGE
jgi:hypothetical protein